MASLTPNLSPSEAQSQRPSLWKLPPELRIHIYSYLLAPEQPFSVTTIIQRVPPWINSEEESEQEYLLQIREYERHHPSDDQFWRDCRTSNKTLHPAILRTSRFVYNEAIEVFYQARIFSFKPVFTGPNALYPEKINIARIRSVTCRFLDRLSPLVVKNIHAIRMPFLLSRHINSNTLDIYHALASRLQNIKILQVVARVTTSRRFSFTDRSPTAGEAIVDLAPLRVLLSSPAFVGAKVHVLGSDRPVLQDSFQNFVGSEEDDNAIKKIKQYLEDLLFREQFAVEKP
jgi:hypothetical protein